MLTFKHLDGKECVWSHFAQRWLCMVHPTPEPGPRERVDYTCYREHVDQLEPQVSDDDRGDFGMPGLGVGRVRDFEEHVDKPRIVNRDGRRTTMTLMVEPMTALAERILSSHAPAALEHFLRRNAEYGDDNDFNLGAAGQYVDISRKVQKLKKRWWDGVEAKDGEESDETIVKELIGHLLMAMDFIEQEGGYGTEVQEPPC